ncbi:hypothetical protein EYF80_058334 [Liparis tanakae]|uniref:Uncharacterized protein n=1 Tax=Liparis tanakae TaxID=230148 RepID=A0A4Z2ET18_9TELE|nr:hypothetical protein EYF80_058334 [Liparis tanakae]
MNKVSVIRQKSKTGRPDGLRPIQDRWHRVGAQGETHVLKDDDEHDPRRRLMDGAAGSRGYNATPNQHAAIEDSESLKVILTFRDTQQQMLWDLNPQSVILKCRGRGRQPQSIMGGLHLPTGS